MKLANPFRFLGNSVRRVREDDRGNVMLLSGMMAFAIMIMAVLAVDTSKGVYNRIVAQNAADAAAETAALMQARGLNLLQHLNNVHFWANWAAIVVEGYDLYKCGQTLVDASNEIEDCLGAVGTFGLTLGQCISDENDRESDCETCAKASSVNDMHDDIAQKILALQDMVAKTFPVLALFYANQVAAESDGDVVFNLPPGGNDALGQYLGNWTQKLAGGIQGLVGSIPTGPDQSGFSTFQQSSGGVLSSLLPSFHAVPLNVMSLSLHVQPVDGGELPFKPWDWPTYLRAAAWADYNLAKYEGCGVIPGLPIGAGAHGDFHDPRRGGAPDDWGWTDQYYSGHPGFMTWMTGKTNRDELAGLGFLRWFDSKSPPQEVDFPLLDQANLPMYTGEFTNQTQHIFIPAFIALASSQVEDTEDDRDGLVDHGDADVAPRLMPVYFPNGTAGTSFSPFPIYH